MNLNDLPLTKIRIFIAKVIYNVLKIFLKDDQRIIHRNGINYKVDLSEGIDLSIFLFGQFQDYIFSFEGVRPSKKSIVIDVGANIGSMALKFAKVFPEGHVYAFEPTHYGFGKLNTNLALNPALSHRITPVQAFLSDKPGENHDLQAYSSWKLNSNEASKHPLHGGEVMSAQSVPALTLDAFYEKAQLPSVDFIKIDTDGHELNVLRGAQQVIKKHHPIIVFEIGLYLLHERGNTVEEVLQFFSGYDYQLFNSKNKKRITNDNYKSEIPTRSSIDIIAIPKGAA